jgi:prefoldin subunit 5
VIDQTKLQENVRDLREQLQYMFSYAERLEAHMSEVMEMAENLQDSLRDMRVAVETLDDTVHDGN